MIGHRLFRLILSPKKGLLHSKFKAVEVGEDNVERPCASGEAMSRENEMVVWRTQFQKITLLTMLDGAWCVSRK